MPEAGSGRGRGRPIEIENPVRVAVDLECEHVVALDREKGRHPANSRNRLIREAVREYLIKRGLIDG